MVGGTYHSGRSSELPTRRILEQKKKQEVKTFASRGKIVYTVIYVNAKYNIEGVRKSWNTD